MRDTAEAWQRIHSASMGGGPGHGDLTPLVLYMHVA